MCLLGRAGLFSLADLSTSACSASATPLSPGWLSVVSDSGSRSSPSFFSVSSTSPPLAASASPFMHAVGLSWPPPGPLEGRFWVLPPSSWEAPCLTTLRLDRAPEEPDSLCRTRKKKEMKKTKCNMLTLAGKQNNSQSRKATESSSRKNKGERLISLYHGQPLRVTDSNGTMITTSSRNKTVTRNVSYSKRCVPESEDQGTPVTHDNSGEAQVQTRGLLRILWLGRCLPTVT
ncbi:hypothetical protein NDU88_000019 [Pleurodeles waltl]|uniref:Uncharacterized protein n=1 Tax=Pleurodeles waltl TaxID=8319 RepID=A0AAV7WJA6_PLEWA|nr:hypothetical protein NDU88_000019 [Pleurodeles waltl]